MVRIVHFRKEKFDIYIGRKSTGMHFGNPFSFGGKSKISKLDFFTRVECINAFREWLQGTNYQDIESERRKWILENITMLKDKVLGCWCSPETCHGDVYAEILDGKQALVKKEPVENYRILEFQGSD